MNIKTALLFLFLFSNIFLGHAQVGTWKYYYNSKNFKDIETIDNYMYFNGERAIFQLNTSTHEVNKLDQTTGLANFFISNLKYNKSKKIMLVAYENQAIDIIDFSSGRKKITPNYDITNKILVADKTIHQIKYIQDDAYLCSKLGIIVFNYAKNEIKATYIIGNRGNYMNVNSIEWLNNTFYALTDTGVMVGLDNVAINLQDYNNWSMSAEFPRIKYVKSENKDNTLHLMSEHSLYEYSNSSLVEVMAKDTNRVYTNLHIVNNKLYVIYNLINANKERISTEIAEWVNHGLVPVYSSPNYELKDIEISKEGDMYVSGRYIFKRNNQDLNIVKTRTEPYDNAYRLQPNKTTINAHIGIMGSNLDASLVEDGMFVLNDNNGLSEWGNNAFWEAGQHSLYNQMSVIDAHNGTYRAYNRGGVIFESNNSRTIFDVNNSTLNTPSDTTFGKVIRVSDMKYNPLDKSVWLLNFYSKNPLKSIDKNGKWRSHNLSMATPSTEVRQLVIDQAGNKWISTRDQGIIMFNEQDIDNPNDDIIKYITSFTTYYKNTKQCELNTKYTLDMELDREGNLWVGTDKGVGIITNCTYDPSQECMYSIPIQTTQTANDTNKYQECIFLNTSVTAIAFDGGNNVWVGTNDGAFYSSEYAGYEALNLNKLNSPMSAKEIFDIAVHPKSGEVIFTTDIGVLGYMGQSTDAKYMEDISPYFITPNPVPKDYDGLISIDGLPENSYYKITDVLGNLMYQGKSNGSRVTWDGKSLNGIKVPTGIYYIFSGKSQLQGKTGVGTFTIIN